MPVETRRKGCRDSYVPSQMARLCRGHPDEFTLRLIRHLNSLRGHIGLSVSLHENEHGGGLCQMCGLRALAGVSRPLTVRNKARVSVLLEDLRSQWQ